MKEKLQKYIEENLEKKETRFGTFFKKKVQDEKFDYEESIQLSALEEDLEIPALFKTREESIDDYIQKEKEEKDFQTLLFYYIDQKELRDSDVYNKVHIDRRLFSKIRSNAKYHPKKETVLLLGLALELKENEIETLLESASYSLPKNNYFDLIIRFCFKEGIYNVMQVNELLDSYHCKLLEY